MRCAVYALCGPCVTRSRVGTHRSGAQYPRDALFKGRNIQELSVGDTSTLHLQIRLADVLILILMGSFWDDDCPCGGRGTNRIRDGAYKDAEFFFNPYFYFNLVIILSLLLLFALFSLIYSIGTFTLSSYHRHCSSFSSPFPEFCAQRWNLQNLPDFITAIACSFRPTLHWMGTGYTTLK
jgi:hypothetical protein